MNNTPIIAKTKNNTPIIAKTMTRLEIAELYNVSWKTLKKRLNRNGIILPSGLVYPKDIQIIYNQLGLPKRTA